MREKQDNLKAQQVNVNREIERQMQTARENNEKILAKEEGKHHDTPSVGDPVEDQINKLAGSASVSAFETVINDDEQKQKGRKSAKKG